MRHTSTSPTLYWHDYETFGIDPKRDRPAQFAGIRTDEALNIMGDPLLLYCQPTADTLPSPTACLLTGITPQEALEKGKPEPEFIAAIHQEFSRPNTCVVGYNNIRFDDEFTRYALFRNFFDPYAREWQNNNSRWDIIDMVRLTRALRPAGIQWPNHEDGRPSYRLEDFTAANQIAHDNAHDALSDVYATIKAAALIKQQQPRLFDYIFSLRRKQQLGPLLNVQEMMPVLHVSAMIPSHYGCLAIVAPIAYHPSNKNGIIVFDLRYDPSPLIELTPEEIRTRLFTPRQDLPAGIERIPLKTVHLNKCPIIVPLNTLTPQAAEQWQIDQKTANQHRQWLLQFVGLQDKMNAVFSQQHETESIIDPEHSLYSGGFFSAYDRRLMDEFRETSPEQLQHFSNQFEDPRLEEMVNRYRARHYPATLSAQESQDWAQFCQQRLHAPSSGERSLSHYFNEIETLQQTPGQSEKNQQLLKALTAYGHGCAGSLPHPIS